MEETWGGVTSRKRGAGYICGPANLAIGSRSTWYTSFSTYNDIPCEVSEVPKEVMLKFMQENREFEEDIFQGTFANFVHIMDDPMDFNPCYHMPEKAVHQIAQHAYYHSLKAGEMVAMPYGGFLAEGSVKRVPIQNSTEQGTRHQFDYKYKEMSFILPNYCRVQALENCDVMIFENPVFAHNFEQGVGDIVEVDVSHLSKGESHKDKYVRGGDAFATHDFSVPLGKGENSKEYMRLAKEALIGDEYATDAVNMIENAGFHDVEVLDETHKLRKFDDVTSTYMHRTIWGEQAESTGLGNRKSVANYDNLRRRQNQDVVEKMMYQQSHLDEVAHKSNVIMEVEYDHEPYVTPAKSPIGPKYREHEQELVVDSVIKNEGLLSVYAKADDCPSEPDDNMFR